MHKILRADPVTLPDNSRGYVSSAPPPDCVALALLGVVEQRPDIVVSGINHGANVGYDVFYSGTVAAAVEAVIEGLPALAISRERHDEGDMALAIARGYHDARPAEEIDYTPIATFCARLTQKVMEHELPVNTFLNVNIPALPWEQIKGITLTRLGRRVYRDELILRQDPRGRPYYWIGGLPPKGVADHGTDIWALENGLISITPINLDMTDHRLIEDLKRWTVEDIPL